jgi:hypothetical protein
VSFIARAGDVLRLKGGGGSPLSQDGSDERDAYEEGLRNDHDCVPNSASGSEYHPIPSSEDNLDDDYEDEVRPHLHAT